jgi:hypothetical protein
MSSNQRRPAESCAACITDRRIHLANCLGIDTEDDASSKDHFEKIFFNVTFNNQPCLPGNAIHRTNKAISRKLRVNGPILRFRRAIHLFASGGLAAKFQLGRVTNI